jgi:hypothetical protein
MQMYRVDTAVVMFSNIFTQFTEYFNKHTNIHSVVVDGVNGGTNGNVSQLIVLCFVELCLELRSNGIKHIVIDTVVCDVTTAGDNNYHTILKMFNEVISRKEICQQLYSLKKYYLDTNCNNSLIDNSNDNNSNIYTEFDYFWENVSNMRNKCIFIATHSLFENWYNNSSSGHIEDDSNNADQQLLSSNSIGVYKFNNELKPEVINSQTFNTDSYIKGIFEYINSSSDVSQSINNMTRGINNVLIMHGIQLLSIHKILLDQINRNISTICANTIMNVDDTKMFHGNRENVIDNLPKIREVYDLIHHYMETPQGTDTVMHSLRP